MFGGKQFHVKGKRVSETVFNAYHKRLKNLNTKSKQDAPDTKSPEAASIDENSPANNTLEIEEESQAGFLEGRRIVEISELAKNLWCGSCKECLSLENIESETRRGLGSIFAIRCHKCLLISLVPTGKQHPDASGRINCFDVNTKMAMGIISAGCSYSHIDKIFGIMNMPNMGFPTFKRYERKIGDEVKAVTKDSCLEAAKEERELTIKNKASIEKMM